MHKTISAAARLSAAADSLIAHNDAKAQRYLDAHGFTMEEVRFGALRRSGEFASPRVGADLYIDETFPKPSLSRGCLRSLVVRSLGLN